MSNNENQTKANLQTTEGDTPKVSNDNSPGKQLVKAREALGLTQQQVADRLHLRINSVKAVEQDALESGISVTFNKGYVRLYARLVQIDTEPLLAAYDQIHQPNNQPANLQSFSRRVSREARDYRWNLVTMVVVLLVLGSVIGWWVQQSDSLNDSQNFVAKTFESLFNESETTQNANTQTQNEKNNDVVELDASDVVHLETGPQISEETAAELDNTNNFAQNLSEDDQSTPEVLFNNSNDALTENIANDLGTIENDLSETSENIQNNNNEVLDDSNEIIDETAETIDDSVEEFTGSYRTDDGILVNEDGTVDMVFTFTDDCWVSIKDVDGEVIAIGVKKKGRVMEVTGLPPIRVILGVPKNVGINFGGKDVDMSVYPSLRSANFALQVETD